MRVMLELTVRNDAGYGDAALMIGAVRLELPVDWRENQAGDRIDVVLVGTDQGYFLVDPTTRTIVPYTDQPPGSDLVAAHVSGIREGQDQDPSASSSRSVRLMPRVEVSRLMLASTRSSAPSRSY